MIRITQLKLPPTAGEADIRQAIRRSLRLGKEESFSFELLRQSVDARKKPDIYYVYTVLVRLSDEKREAQVLRQVRGRHAESARIISYAYGSLFRDPLPIAEPDRPVIIGTGPAGLFCGLLLARAGLCPVLIERGMRADERTAAVQRFWSGAELDPDSNVQFGEGGAGTFSDGKLNTGVKDPEGRIRFILRTFVEAGADPDILFSYKPHIGTDVLVRVVRTLTDEIRARGGEVLFSTRLESLEPAQDGDPGRSGPVWKLYLEKKREDGTEEKKVLHAAQVVLAIGHSARDTFRMLNNAGFAMTEKAFAVGLRIQHPQEMIDRALFGEDCPYDLGAAPYKLTHRLANGKGVYSFCMRPGGSVVNASSEHGFLAVNGMSTHGRDSGMANSAVVVTVSPEDVRRYMDQASQPDFPAQRSPDDPSEPFAGLAFQRMLERRAFLSAGGRIPVQRFEDYRKQATGTGEGRFTPQFKGLWKMADVRSILPGEIADGIEEGILAWDRQIRGFADPDALLAGVESRTASPLRIERGPDLQAIGHPGIYPCGEGAGYAGGITSAALDGLRAAEAVIGPIMNNA